MTNESKNKVKEFFNRFPPKKDSLRIEALEAEIIALKNANKKKLAKVRTELLNEIQMLKEQAKTFEDRLDFLFESLVLKQKRLNCETVKKMLINLFK